MMPRRFDSLLLRLLLAQLVLVGCAVLIFGALLVIERNALLAPPLAALWAPQIQVAVRAPAGVTVPAYGIETGILRHADPPTGWQVAVTRMPAATDFIRALAAQGVVADEVRLVLEQGRLVFWLHVRPAGAAPIWLSGYGLSPLPHWSLRMTVGIALLLVVIGLASRRFARRVTRPMAQLRARMQQHARTGIEAAALQPLMQAVQAPPELVEIDRAYTLLAERLQRNERERALLLAGVSHDLRSPLSRIRLAAEMLPELPDNADGVASITRNVDHADRLTASFLDFVRTGAVHLTETVDVAAVARAAVARFDRPAAELLARAPERLVLQQAHGLLVERLIVNLVDNALKHGGTPVVVDVAQAGDEVVISVSDAGPGLPLGGAARLLEAFARGDASRGVPGFGLGLAIAQQIVMRLQGQLAFAQDGQRHRVTVSLPFVR
jgi:two-component system osmolarity sensor histidine kinase EnvZ